MDEFLSKLYGTESLVKEAAEEQQANEEVVGNFITGVESLCKEAEVDPDSLSDEDVTNLWNEYVGDLQKTAELENAPGAEKYAGLSQENFEQSDAMGRIAAHANVDEMSKIADAKVEAQEKAYKKLHSTGAIKGLGQNIAKVWKSGKGGKAALIAAPAAGLAGGGYGASKLYKKLKEKKGSDEEVTQVIHERAYELLKEANWLFDTGEPIPPQVGAEIIKQAQEGEPEKKPEKKEEKKEKKEEEGEEAEKQAFVHAVDEAALELLKDNGYPINE